MINKDKQIQKAGDNATQIQAQTVIMQGPTRDEIHSIFSDEFELVKQEFIQDARKIAEDRVLKFEENFAPRFMQVEKSIDLLKTPEFLYLLSDAEKVAARTDSENDYELLSELLMYRVESDVNRKKETGIKNAVKIVDQIDYDALQGLTLVYVFLSLRVLNGDVETGIKNIDQLFREVQSSKLPDGLEWIDQLDILNAVRTSHYSKFKKFDEIFFENYDGWICAGVKKDSEVYEEVLKIINQNGLPFDILVDNALLPGYCRINTSSLEQIDISILVPTNEGNVVEVRLPVDDSKLKCVHQIIGMYDDSKSLNDTVKDAYRERIKGYPSIVAVKKWWDEIPDHFHITSVGKCISHTNAKLHFDKVPDIDNIW